ncbi:MAG: DNA repair protein RecO, partial [Ginsengibacter sp.]
MIWKFKADLYTVVHNTFVPMIYKTKGIVLRTIKYGETSIVTNIFTEEFGVQSYLVNGIRTSGKSSSKAGMFQPTSILALEAYHNDLKNLQRLKEFRWSYLYQSVLTEVTKNSVAIFIVELLYKCLKQPEKNIQLFAFCEDAFIALDKAKPIVTANFPLYFSIHLAAFFGFSPAENSSQTQLFFDLQEGKFVNEMPTHSYYLDAATSTFIAEILKARHPDDLAEIKMNKTNRRVLMIALQT